MSAPACWNSGAPFANGGTTSGFAPLDPWSPASQLPHTCHLCGEFATVSFVTPTGANRCTQCSQVAACP